MATAWLLPDGHDVRRLELEEATQFAASIQRTVRRLIASSITRGTGYALEFQYHRIIVHVLCREEAYLAIGTEGYLDPRVIATILASVPHADWQAEAGEALGLLPGPGQIVYSTMISPALQAELLNDHVDDDT